MNKQLEKKVKPNYVMVYKTCLGKTIKLNGEIVLQFIIVLAVMPKRQRKTKLT